MDSNDDVVGAVKTRSKRITAGSVFSFNMSQTVEVEQPLPISWPFYGQVHFERNLGRVKFLGKLKDNIHQLSLVYGDLSRKDAEIRLKLRCHRGHRGKVNNTVIVWLEQVERTAKKFNSITSQLRKTSRSKFYSLQILVVAKKVVKLIDEVKFLVESAASLIFFNDRNGAERGPGKMTSLVGQMAQKISSQIWTHLTDPSIRTICLYGLGGVGKTTMMRNINSELASTAIFDEIIWATLSKNVNWEKVQDDIAQQLGIELPATRQVEVRAKTIFEHVKSVERCLFIIDDVWESLAFDLETMGIPEGEHKGCKIVFTTRFLRVGRFMRVDKNIKLAPLSESEAWELFCSKSGNQVINSDIQNTAKEVLIACLGLPITIITVGHAMRDKVSGSAWSSALRDLQSTQHETQRAVENLLRFGFRHLKNDQVRSCFLYCAFFPEDFKFEPKELIEYWMAEDFISNKEGILRAVDDGFEILKDLKDANMLEILVEGGTEWLKMHDLFRDLAIAIMTEEFDYLMKPGLKIKEFPRILEYVRAKKISLIRNEIERLEIVCFCSKLSTLLLKDNPLSHISFSFFSQMPSLQFVDLSYSGITQLPPSLCELPKLRVLFLQYCTSLQKIPSVKDLRELQVFSLRGTLIKELPYGMKDLVSLKSLDLSETVRLELIEVGVVSSLIKLEELQMQGSRLCRMESSTTVKCFNEIRNLKNLIILTLSAVGFGDYLETILHLQEHSLKSFSINVYGSTHDYSDDI